MYRKQVRRRRAVLVLLVVGCLALISTQFSEGDDGPLHSVQNGVGAALGPLGDGASRVFKPFRDLANWFDETFDARGENEQLRSDVQELQRELADTQSELEQGIEQGKVAKITAESELAGFDPVDARVVIRSPSSWNQSLGINEGRNSGIEVDDAVINGDGLVGRVSEVNSGNALVTLLTNQDSAVTARVLKNGLVGLVGPEVGDPSALLFELIESDKQLSNGDKLVSAGFSGDKLRSRFPAGIPIGEIAEENPAEQERRQQVHIDSAADFNRLDQLTVLTGGG